MEARLNLLGSPLAAKSVRPIASAGEVLADSTLPAATQELVRLRASQRLPNSCPNVPRAVVPSRTDSRKESS